MEKNLGAARSAPEPIRACWLSWIAVNTADQDEVIARLGLTVLREISWADGVELIDEVAHSGDKRFETVVVTPSVECWTLVVGAWCGLPYMKNVLHVTELCRDLSERFGLAQAYFVSEQNDGEAWLITENGTVTRRWIGEYPELAIGAPSGHERRRLDAFGIGGRPEDLDPDDELLADWVAEWGIATDIAADLSLDPTKIGPGSHVLGPMLVAAAPRVGAKGPTAA